MIIVRDRRWIAGLVVGIAGLLVSGVLLTNAIFSGATVAVSVLAFVGFLALTVISNVELRPRLIGDRAGLRLQGRFIPWPDVTDIRTLDADSGTAGTQKGEIEVDGGEVLTLPLATHPEQVTALIEVWKHAPKSTRSPLRLLPMDREPLSFGAGRAAGSVTVALLVLLAMLWSQLPSVGPPEVAATPHFPSTALRPLWTHYLNRGNGDFNRSTSASPAGLFVLEVVAFVEAAPINDQGFAAPPAPPNGGSAVQLTRIAPGGQVLWSRLVTPAIPWSPMAIAAGPSGVLMSFDYPARSGQRRCCDLQLLDNDGSRVWEGRIDFAGDQAEPFSVGRDFLVVDPRRDGTRFDRNHADVFVVAGSGGITSTWNLDITRKTSSHVWGSESGLLVSTQERGEDTSQLTKYAADGQIQWRGFLPGEIYDVDEGAGGTFALTEVYQQAVAGAWISRIDEGDVAWSRLNYEDRVPYAYYGPHSRFSLLVDGEDLYQVEQRAALGRLTHWVERLDPDTGDSRNAWQVATVKYSPTITVADGIAYLTSLLGERAYSVQRLEWPPGKSEPST